MVVVFVHFLYFLLSPVSLTAVLNFSSFFLFRCVLHIQRAFYILKMALSRIEGNRGVLGVDYPRTSTCRSYVGLHVK